MFSVYEQAGIQNHKWKPNTQLSRTFHFVTFFGPRWVPFSILRHGCVQYSDLTLRSISYHHIKAWPFHLYLAILLIMCTDFLFTLYSVLLFPDWIIDRKISFLSVLFCVLFFLFIETSLYIVCVTVVSILFLLFSFTQCWFWLWKSLSVCVDIPWK